MKSFLEFILEMTVDDAMKIFGITEVPSTKEELDKSFKKLALKNHPDLGGSEEKMKQLNLAKELLSNNLGKKSNFKMNVDFEEIDRRNEMLEKEIVKTLEKFDENSYKKYLEEIFGIPFTVKKEMKELYSYSKINNHKLIMEFADKERDKVFILHFYANRPIIYTKIYGTNKGLTTPSKTFDINMKSFVYIDGKKQVLTKERSVSNSDTKMFTDASLLLPKTKLMKLAKGEVRKNSKLSKRDFKAMFEAKFSTRSDKGYGNTEWYYITVGDYVVVIYRSVFDRKLAYYVLHCIGKKPTSKFRYYDEFITNSDLIKKYPKTSIILENKDGFDFMLKWLTNLKNTGNIDMFLKELSTYKPKEEA